MVAISMNADTPSALPTTPIISIQDRVAAHAAQLGEDAGRIATQRLNVVRMRELGTLVDIDVHGFTLFTVRANWLELGIPEVDRRARRFTKGSKHLVPERYVNRLNSLDSSFRKSLDRHSFGIAGFRPYRWVPFTAYQDWKAEWAAYQEKLTALKADLLADYDAIRAELVEDFTQIAREAWDALVVRRGGSTESALDLGGGSIFENRDAFVAHVVARALDRLPTPEDIQAGIYVTYHNALLLSQADVEADHLAAAQLQAAQAEAHARTARAEEEERAQRRLAWQEEQAQERAIEARERAQRELIQLELREREAQVRAMHQAELEHARQQIAAMSPLREVFDQLRAQIYRDVQEIADGIHKHGYLHGKTAQKAEGLLATFRLLNAHGDEELEQMLEALQAQLERRVADPERKGRTVRDVAAVTERLQEIARLTHDAAKAVAKSAGATRAGALML